MWIRASEELGGYGVNLDRTFVIRIATRTVVTGLCYEVVASDEEDICIPLSVRHTNRSDAEASLRKLLDKIQCKSVDWRDENIRKEVKEDVDKDS